MLKFLFMLTVMTTPVMSYAQVNTGGPDFVLGGVTVHSDLPKALRMNKGSKVPTVLHDPGLRTYIAMRTEDLYKIYEVYHPESADEFVRILRDSSRFIEVSLMDYMHYTGGTASEIFQYSYGELYSLDAGNFFQIFSAKAGGSAEDIERVFGEVRIRFGNYEAPLIYAPASSPVW